MGKIKLNLIHFGFSPTHTNAHINPYKFSLFFFRIDSELSKDTTIFLQFKNKELEANYAKQRESMSSLPLVAAILVQFVASIYSSIILPSSFIHFLAIFMPIILLLPIVWISIAESFPMVKH